jgi:L-fuculose-phosphate aldolase
MSAILRELIETAKELSASGFVTGAGGNVSARDGDVMWISPSGFSFDDATEEDYPAVSIATGEIVRGDRRPSSEVLMHLYSYRVRPDIQAMIHTHPKLTIALTSAGHDLRPMYADYYVYLGKNVPHVPYVTVTTPELAAVVEDAFRAPDVRGMILRNHGAITVGESIKEATFRTLAVEEQAFIQWHALQVGEPTYLSDEELGKLDELGSEDYRRKLLASMKG